MAKEIIFPDQQLIDDFGDYLDDGNKNDSMMKTFLKPLFDFTDSSKSLKDMQSNYHSLLWNFKSSNYYDRFAQMNFLGMVHGFNSMSVEQEQPFKDIKSFDDMVIIAKDVEEALKNMKLADILYALGVKPEKAIEYFEKQGIVISKDWKEALKNARNHSFTITKVMSADILKDFKDLLTTALKDGTSLQDFRKQIKDKLADKGWLGKVISDKPGQEKIDSPWRLNLIYRQNLQTAYNHGRWDRVQETVKTWPHLQFLSTIDKVTTKACIGLHLLVMSIGDKKIKLFLPPGHYHCRRRFRVINDSIFKKKGMTLTKGSSIMNLRNMEGFEFTGIGGWKPDYSKYPPEIINELKKKA